MRQEEALGHVTAIECEASHAIISGLLEEQTLITAFGDEALHQEAERLGAASVLDKPFELEELRAAVRRVLKPH